MASLVASASAREPEESGEEAEKGGKAKGRNWIGHLATWPLGGL